MKYCFSIVVLLFQLNYGYTQQQKLTLTDLSEATETIEKLKEGIKNANPTDKLPFTYYDGSALRFVLSKTNPDFLNGTTAEELIAELSALRAESMKQLLPEILAPLQERNRKSLLGSSSGALLQHSQQLVPTWSVTAIAFFPAVKAILHTPSSAFKITENSWWSYEDVGMTAVNEYELILKGQTANVREEITYSIDKRHVKFRHVKRETVEKNDDSTAIGAYVVERGMFGTQPGTNTVKLLHPRRLKPANTHRVTTEIIREVTVDRCPNATGISHGVTLCSMTTRATAGVMDNGSPLLMEIISRGNANGQVSDAAVLTGFDWEVSSESRWESLNTGQNFNMKQTMSIQQVQGIAEPKVTLSGFDANGSGSMDDAKKLKSIQDDSQLDMYVPLIDSYQKAENEWRGGGCVELVITTGSTPKKISAGESRKIVVEARHSYEPPPLAVPVTSAASGATINPTQPVKTPAATFTLKPEGDKESFVTFSSVSRRGIAKDVFASYNSQRVPIKISVQYFQNEKEILKKGTLPGVDVEGGDEITETNMSHTAIIYHYASLSDLNAGLLVNVLKEKQDNYSKNFHLLEVGHFNYTKKVEDATFYVLMGNKRVPAGVEKGETKSYEGTASIQHLSQVNFFKGDAQNPPSFGWDVEYPASNGEDIAAGAVSFSKGDDGVKWQVNKITDPNSPYKTEYILEQTLDAAEELKKGNKAMKDWLGFDVNDIGKITDPTKPKDIMVTVSGTRTVIVRILSPYAEK